MAEQAAAGRVRIFVYTGGQQVVPSDVTHVRIDRSVEIIPERAFYKRKQLMVVEFHNGVKCIGNWAFLGCTSLRSLNLTGIKTIGSMAFKSCYALMDVDVKFDDYEGRTEISKQAFDHCTSLRRSKFLGVRQVQKLAFNYCTSLTDVEFDDKLETIDEYAFHHCLLLTRISIPLKDGIFLCPNGRRNQFDSSDNLTTVDLVGIEGIHNTISFFVPGFDRNDVYEYFDMPNQALRNVSGFKTAEYIKDWIEERIKSLEHGKEIYKPLLNEGMAQLELALWNAKLDENEGELEREGVRITRGRRQRARKESCVTSGADIVIKNVLPFLELDKLE